MAHGHEPIELPPEEARTLGAQARPIHTAAFVVGVIGLMVALLAAAFVERGWARFAHAYLINFVYVLSIALGCLCFVLLQHLARAGWSVVVRRPAEVIAANIPLLGVLFAPLLVFVLLNDGQLYPWAQPLEKQGDSHAQVEPGYDAAIVTVADEHGDAHADASHGDDHGHAAAGEAHGDEQAHLAYVVAGKRIWLNTPFFIVRCILYLAIWSAMGLWLWRLSTRQDRSGDATLTTAMERLSAPLTLLFGITITLAAFDLIMSIDPKWYSTIFGGYYFAGGFLGAIATLILVIMGLQKWGYFQSVTVEHQHDLGKLLFAFVFFWGYIAFSQYMLLWYANLPETAYWFDTRGWTTVPERMTGWSYVGLIMLFGHLLIPFVCLLPRWAKRNRRILAFWAVWLLVMHWIDLFWVVMPEFDSRQVTFGLIEIGCLLGVAGLFVGGAVRLAAQHALVPVRDPRLAESLAHENL